MLIPSTLRDFIPQDVGRLDDSNQHPSIPVTCKNKNRTVQVVTKKDSDRNPSHAKR